MKENKKSIDKIITRENQTKYACEVDLLPNTANGKIMWERISELMDFYGEKLVTISRRLGYEDSSSLSRSRTDNVMLSTVNVIKLAKYFNVSTDYLLGLTNLEKSNYMEETEKLEEIYHCLISSFLEVLPEERHQPFLEKLIQKNA